jgi:hypothetical protein
MSFTYLNNQTWTQITRDERFFCCELYHEIKKDTATFIRFLQTKLPAIESESKVEVGFEVCFFRDYIKHIGEANGNKSVKGSVYSQKRTFDLCLFTDTYIAVIEAKAHTGFNTVQLNSFEEDKQNIRLLLGDKCPEIYSIALTADGYSPKKASVKGFDCMINWKEMHELYPNPVFLRANKTDMVTTEE